MTTLLLLLSALAALILHRIITTLRAPLTKLPGPWYTAVSSLPLQYHRLTGNVTHWTHSLSLQYGPVVRLAPARVAVNDASLWEEIHRMGSGFTKTRFHGKIKVGPDQMLFGITDDKLHTKRRKLFARALGMGTLRENWEAQVRQKVELAVRQIRSEAEKGTADVQKWWKLLAGDVIALLAFGESFELLEDGGGLGAEKGQAKGKGKGGSEYFEALDSAGVNIMLDSMFPRPLLRAVGRVWGKLGRIVFANDVVTERGTIAVTNLRQEGLGRPNLFSNMLAEAQNARDGVEESQWLTDDAIRSEAGGFLLAGSDTTAMSLTYMVWAVLRRPELQRRVEAEVATLIPKFTDKDVEKLPLLNNVLDEVLRLYNPGSGNIVRQVPAQGVTWHGHYIPGGVDVSTQQWTMVRDDSLFPNAEEFDETRFETATDKQRRIAQPFGIGKRNCIGVHLAKMELRLATALFFRQCRGMKLSKDMTEDMMVQLMKFFTYPKGGRCDVTLVDSLAQN